ncbi:hypothetical protein [Bosea minatitlanensis]|uniref:Uncharacterized protein n=1 Tax=Bosea minatitlanensis TaxID=128782 RepID=A0ABW0F2F1_9HYPH|nr:hypothetical protein [Bosea minatitlanensis]MCT4492689.1 hypothetical protein [Bosea minatitlanensis]
MKGSDVASASCPQELSEDERFIRAGLANGSLIGVGASAIEPLIEEIDRLRASERAAVDELCRWRAAFQRVTPGGSEFFSPQAVREWADKLKLDVFEANKRAALAERRVRENSPAGLADAHSKSPSHPAMPKEEDTHG